MPEVVDVAALLGQSSAAPPSTPGPEVVDVAAALGVPEHKRGVLAAITRRLFDTEYESLSEFDKDAQASRPQLDAKSLGLAAVDPLHVRDVVAMVGDLPNMARKEATRIKGRWEKAKAAPDKLSAAGQAAGMIPVIGEGAASAGETIGRRDFSGGATEAAIAVLNGLLVGSGAKAGLRGIERLRAARALREANKIKAEIARKGFVPTEEPLGIDPAAPAAELPSAVQAALRPDDAPVVFEGETGPAQRAAGVAPPERGPAAPPVPRVRESMDSGLVEIAEPGRPIQLADDTSGAKVDAALGLWDEEASPEIADLEMEWAGGVADAGNPAAGYLVQDAPYYREYLAGLQDSLRRVFGDRIPVYRSMSRAEYEAWANGDDLGPKSFSMEPDVAEKWANFAGNKGEPKIVVRADAPIESVIMRGKVEEAELVLDGNQISFHELHQVDPNAIRVPSEPLGMQLGGVVPPALEAGVKQYGPNPMKPVEVQSPMQTAELQAAIDEAKSFTQDYMAVLNGAMTKGDLLRKYNLPATLTDAKAAARIMAERVERAKEGIGLITPGVGGARRVDQIPGRVQVPDSFEPAPPNTLRQPPTFQAPPNVKAPPPPPDAYPYAERPGYELPVDVQKVLTEANTQRPVPVPPDPSVSTIPFAPENPPAAGPARPQSVVIDPKTGRSLGYAPEAQVLGDLAGISQPAKEIPASVIKRSEDFIHPDASTVRGGDLNSAIQKLTENIGKAKTARKSTALAQAAERAKRFSLAEKILGDTGDIGQAKHALGGELPRAHYEPFGNLFSNRERQLLTDAIKDAPGLDIKERVRAYDALGKVLDGGAVPQPNEIALLGRAFGPEVAEALAAKARTWTQSAIAKAWNIPRTLLSGPDMSMIMRQAKVAVSGHPVIATKNVWKGLNAWVEGVSKDPSKTFLAVSEEIANRKNAKLYRLSGVDFTLKSELGALAATEENYLRNNLVTRIPVLGRLYKASEESALTFLNRMRADVFDDMAEPFLRMGKTFESDPQLFRDLGRWVNITTGRGGLGAAGERVAGELATIFFAPRLASSNFAILNQMLNPVAYVNAFRKNPKLASMMYRDLAAYAGSRATMVALAGIAGYDLNDDPISAEFGKIRKGRARLDVFGGGLQSLRLINQLIAGKRTKLSGERVPMDRMELLGEFAMQRRHPSLKFVMNAIRQKGDRGEKYDFGQEVGELLAALPLQDLITLSKEQPDALWMIVPAILGSSITAYDEPSVLSEQDKLDLRAAEAARSTAYQLGQDIKAHKPKRHEPSPQERRAYTEKEQVRRTIELELWQLIENREYARARSVARRAKREYNFDFKVDKMRRSKEMEIPITEYDEEP